MAKMYKISMIIIDKDNPIEVDDIMKEVKQCVGESTKVFLTDVKTLEEIEIKQEDTYGDIDKTIKYKYESIMSKLRDMVLFYGISPSKDNIKKLLSLMEREVSMDILEDENWEKMQGDYYDKRRN